MKTFINKPTSIKAPVAGTNEVKEMTYANLAQLILNVPPQGGWTKDEMKIRIKIEDKLDNLKTDKAVDLEDAEMQKIVACAEQPWQFKHKDLLAFLDDLDDWNKEN